MIAAPRALTAAAFLAAGLAAPLKEPYAWLNNGSFSGPTVPASRDPLVSYVWGPGTAWGAMQVFPAPPVLVEAAPPTAAAGLPTLVSAPYGSASASISGNATLLIDFGTEHGAWLEFLLAPGGLPPHVHIAAAISEYDTPRANPYSTPVAYDGGAFRVETNTQLYDGLRYAWLFVTFDASCGGADSS